MSNPYGPDIETVDDWNDALACCCQMPVVDPPVQLCESVLAIYYAVTAETSAGVGYLTADVEMLWWDADNEFQNAGPAPDFEIIPDEFSFTTRGWDRQSVTCGDADFELAFDSAADAITGTDYTSRSTSIVGFSNPWTSDGYVSAILSDFEGFTFPLACPPRTGCVASFSGDIDDDGGLTNLEKVRYRWQVPSTHLGDYYKITWDVLYEPVGWDDESIPEAERPIRFSRKDLTVEWEGPGSGPQDDPSWLAGDWQALEVPDEPGTRRVINVRFTQFRDGP